MASTSSKVQKNTTLSVKEKFKIIGELKAGCSKKNIAKKYGISETTVYRIISSEDKISQIVAANKNVKQKRTRTGNYAEIEKSLAIWVSEMQAKNAVLDGSSVRDKAKDFAKILNLDFKPTTGWLERWKKRENISFRKHQGEKQLADFPAASNWKSLLPQFIANYDMECIYIAGESAMFYKNIRNYERNATFCGHKNSKERLTVLLITNATGTDKHIVAIGNAKNPRCFRNKNLPVEYYSNDKAWMTSKIWESILNNWNTKLAAKNKKIVLFVDNASCHSQLNLTHIKIEFLPPNTTAVIQPLDEGIITSFKSHYQKDLIRRQLVYLDSDFSFDDFIKTIDLYVALTAMKNAWESVTDQTIRNAFLKCGFHYGTKQESVSSDSIIDGLEEDFKEEDIPCFGDLTDEEIVQMATDDDNEVVDEDDVVPQLEKPTKHSALKSLLILKQFNDHNSDILHHIEQIEKLMSIDNFNLNKKQTQINDYFRHS